MKIAVTATGTDLDAKVDPRFGRCPYFLIIETEDLSFEALENFNAHLGGGAGIQSARLMAEKGVRDVLTGNCGPKAHEALSAAGIGVMVGCSGTVRQVVEQYRAGQFAAASGPNVAGHFGTRGGPARGAPQTFGGGRGRGGGRGMGGGRGGGKGGGGGMGRGRGGMGRGADW